MLVSDPGSRSPGGQGARSTPPRQRIARDHIADQVDGDQEADGRQPADEPCQQQQQHDHGQRNQDRRQQQRLDRPDRPRAGAEQHGRFGRAQRRLADQSQWNNARFGLRSVRSCRDHRVMARSELRLAIADARHTRHVHTTLDSHDPGSYDTCIGRHLYTGGNALEHKMRASAMFRVLILHADVKRFVPCWRRIAIYSEPAMPA